MQVKKYLIIMFVIAYIVFGLIYTMMGDSHFNNFTSYIDGLYLSMTTASTTGYGDITPKTNSAKFLVMSQMFVTLLIMAAIVLD
jgi:voltage-gated potassium channel